MSGVAPPVQVAPDSLRAVLDSVFADPRYRWAQPVDARNWFQDLWNALVDWLLRFKAESPVAFNWFYIGLIVLLAAILAHGLWVFYRAVQAAKQPAEGGVTALRGEIHDERWYRRLAQQLAAQERYGEAMSALFSAQVLTLDRQAILAFHPSKTPAEYAREARLAPDQRHAMHALVTELYRCNFAGERCRRDDFLRWRDALTRDWHAAPH